VLEACVQAKVAKIIVSSSGAAYGYHADQSPWLSESDPIRGNEEFPYSYHKRLVEEMLAQYRTEHPELKQVVFRIGTVLGETVNNQITNLFEQPRILRLSGSDSPFVFIWDQDLVQVFLKAIHQIECQGVFNVAGDGAVGMSEIARRLGKPLMTLPAGLVKVALTVLHRLKLTQYGPEQTKFLRFRPVLDNRKLKEVFGYAPQKSSSEVFDFWAKSKGYLK
jgi:UDP-glucose 4-epimerase